MANYRELTLDLAKNDVYSFYTFNDAEEAHDGD